MDTDAISNNLKIIVVAIFIIAQIVAAVLTKSKPKEEEPPITQKPQAPKPTRATAMQQPQTQKSPRATMQKSQAKKPTTATLRQPQNKSHISKNIHREEPQATVNPHESARAQAQNAYGAFVEKENELTALARNGIVWSEILQPPVSMR